MKKIKLDGNGKQLDEDGQSNWMAKGEKNPYAKGEKSAGHSWKDQFWGRKSIGIATNSNKI